MSVLALQVLALIEGHIFREYLFELLHPKDAISLANTCKSMWELVMATYRVNRREIILPGGAWHRLMNKRCKEQIPETLVNWTPAAIKSLVDSRCFKCGGDSGDSQKKFSQSKGPQHWGFLSHDDCIRPCLINTHFLGGSSGVGVRYSDTLPKHQLIGFRGYPQKQRFTYDVIPKENEKGIHPPIYLFIKINE